MATRNIDEMTESPLVDAKKFYIFGQGISFSMSPTLHNAAFSHYILPYTYEIHQTETVDELSSQISSPLFGGASVTMPHKIGISKFCSSISEHAKTIGAINTLIVESAGHIRGDNTDWTGLVSILKLKSEGFKNKALEAGLVIGAGGASRAALYALHQNGIKNIFLYNRTKATAESIATSYASHFPITVIETLEIFAAQDVTKPDVIIGTIPANKSSFDDFPKGLFTKSEGVCIDMSYMPRFTPLMAAAEKYGNGGWSTVAGIEVLLEQGFDQFKLWTGKKAPKSVMIDALHAQDVKNAVAIP